MKVFKGAHQILTSSAGSLQGLAKVVGLTPEELFEGEDFRGVDLTDEPVELLLKIDAKFDGAILTRAQAKALTERGVRNERTSREELQRWHQLIEDSIASFVRDLSPNKKLTRALVNGLSAPLKAGIILPGVWGESLRNYVPQALRLVFSQVENFGYSNQWAARGFLDLAKFMRLPIETGVIRVLHENRVFLGVEDVKECIEFDDCSEQFIYDWLDHVADEVPENLGQASSAPAYGAPIGMLGYGEGLYSSPTEDEYFLALKLAATQPSRPSYQYRLRILSRARSAEETRALVGIFSGKAADKETKNLLARFLAQSATTEEQIIQAALDEDIFSLVRVAFKSLVISSGSDIGRNALIKMVVDRGERASAIEVDSILMELTFDEGISLMKPYWSRISGHHRLVALDALYAIANNDAQRARVSKLRREFLK